MRIVLALVAFSLPLGAQTTNANPGAAASHAVLRGSAVDSVRGGYLKGASVGLLGPSRMALTDSRGHFFMDSIPPGEYPIALFDEMLDSLAMSVVSAPIMFSAGDTVTLHVAVPSPNTIIAAKCGPAAAEDQAAALFGRVFRAHDGSPVDRADVRVEWLEVNINQATGVQSRPGTRTAKSDSTGRYSLCGLPEGLNAEITVRLGEDSTAVVPMIFGESRLGIANFFLPSSAAGRASRPVGAPVRGRVLDTDGNAVSNAAITLSSSPTATTSGMDGRFEIAAHRLGTQSLLIRKLGHEPAELVVNVLPGPTQPVSVQLDPFVPIIESVIIQARHTAALEQVGFARRKRYGLGRYYEAKDLENVSSLQNFFQSIPVLNRRSGLPTVFAGSRGSDIIDARDAGPGGSRRRPATASEGSAGGESGSCRATYVDGVLVESVEFIAPSEIAAIEVYSASMTPTEFKKGYATCSTVVIWTDWKLRRRPISRSR